MSAGIDVGGTITQALWKPKLIRLTQIANPRIDGGQPTPLYVDPAMIAQIYRSETVFNNSDGTKSEPFVCTSVHCCHFSCAVIETPEQIAAMRDSALGYKQELKTV